MFVRQEEDGGDDGEVEEGGEVAGEGRMATKSINKSGSRGISATREKVERARKIVGVRQQLFCPQLLSSDLHPFFPSFFSSFETAIRATTDAAPPPRNSPLTNC